MDKFTRLLLLVALLEQRGSPQTFEQIREQLGEDAYSAANPESARRKFERDKEDLLSMGVPLRSEPLHEDPSNTGYTIRRERSKVADPGFTPAELAALRMAATAMALRHEGVSELADAADGLRKYGGMASLDLPTGDHTQQRVAEIRLDANITELFGAVIERRPVAFSYNDRTRLVAPLHLSFLGGNWYVRAHDFEAGDDRTFRLDRIEGAVIPAADNDDSVPLELQEASPVPETTGRFRPWEFGQGESTEVTVAFDPPAAAVALAQHPDLREEDVGREGDPDGDVLVSFSVRSPDGLWSWLLQFVDRARVVDPPGPRADYLAYVKHLMEQAEETR